MTLCCLAHTAGTCLERTNPDYTGEDTEQRTSLLKELQSRMAISEGSFTVFYKTKHSLTIWYSNCLISGKSNWKNMSIRNYSQAICIWQNLGAMRCPPVGEWVHPIMVYYPPLKRKRLLCQEKTSINLRHTLLKGKMLIS